MIEQYYIDLKLEKVKFEDNYQQKQSKKQK